MKEIMKRIGFLIYLINISLLVFANDTYFYIAGGNVIPAEPNITNVEMVSEVINIELFDDYYSVSVDFIFYNNGIDEKLLVGFPYLLQKQGGEYSTRKYDFRTWVNDQLFHHSNDKIEYSEQGYGEIIVDHAFTKNVFFPSKTITKTKVEYKVEYGRNSYTGIMATYYYGSGRDWYNNIGKMIINIKNNILKTDSWIYNIQMPQVGYGNYSGNIPVENHVNWINGYLQIQLNTIEPNENDTIAIWIGPPL